MHLSYMLSYYHNFTQTRTYHASVTFKHLLYIGGAGRNTLPHLDQIHVDIKVDSLHRPSLKIPYLYPEPSQMQILSNFSSAKLTHWRFNFTSFNSQPDCLLTTTYFLLPSFPIDRLISTGASTVGLVRVLTSCKIPSRG